MKKRLSIRELFYAAWEKFTKAFMTWLLLFGTQILVVFGFLLCCSISLAILHYFLVDLPAVKGFMSGYSKFLIVSMISIISVFCAFFAIVFPIMYKQNALDAAFDRPMSGFDVNNRFFSYAVAMFFYWMLVLLASCLGFFPGIFLAQRWRFAGLYLLDHGGNVRQAFRSSWNMTQGNVWFLVGVSMIQGFLFMLCSPTMLFVLAAVALNKIIDAMIYKQLHIKEDEKVLVCACEV